MSIYYQDYIKKLILLETKLGHKISYGLLDPSLVDEPTDIVSIQKAAGKIAEFVGLSHLQFIIGTTTKSEKVAGDIDLQYGRQEVYIELSTSLLEYPDAIKAVLAHEIAHKYLHECGIRLSNSHENEILTDIAGVFLGLGRLMLNGCVCVRQIEDATHTLKIGYLTLDQVAYVYLLLCYMRKISPSNYEYGLKFEALEALGSIRSKYVKHLLDEYLDSGYMAKSVSEVMEFQKELRPLQIHYEIIQKTHVAELRKILREGHRWARAQLDSLTDGEAEYDPVLRYLKNLRHCNNLQQSAAHREKISESIDRMNIVRKTLDDLYDTEIDPSVPKCPFDGADAKLDQGVAHCQKCGYRFSVLTEDKVTQNRPTKSVKKWSSRRMDFEKVVIYLIFIIMGVMALLEYIIK